MPTALAPPGHDVAGRVLDRRRDVRPGGAALETYGVELLPVAAAYAAAVRALPAVVAWCEDARRETAFVAHDEPYRTAPEHGAG
ncbi:MAG: hypothetical protein U0168_07795 [Nannocystaceae bacterium]